MSNHKNETERLGAELEACRRELDLYFTGDPLAKLLVAIAGGSRCRSAIDPMCGSGDMLAAVNEAAPEAELAGIEIALVHRDWAFQMV